MKGNLLKLQDLKKNSKWCDKDRAMLYACFQLLVDFIEKEKPDTIMDVKHDEEQKRLWKELRTLYRYWKVEHVREEKAVHKALMKWAKSYKVKWVPDPRVGPFSTHVILKEDKKVGKFHRGLEDRFHQKEEEMLSRLMKVRKQLWC